MEKLFVASAVAFTVLICLSFCEGQGADGGSTAQSDPPTSTTEHVDDMTSALGTTLPVADNVESTTSRKPEVQKAAGFKCYVCDNADGSTACPPGVQGDCDVEQCHVKSVGDHENLYNWIRGCGCIEGEGQECCDSPLCNKGNLASALTVSVQLAVISSALAFFMNL